MKRLISKFIYPRLNLLPNRDWSLALRLRMLAYLLDSGEPCSITNSTIKVETMGPEEMMYREDL